MDNIWLLFFVGYIIYKMFGKKLPEVTNRRPRDWETRLPRPGRQDSPDWGRGFPWDWDDEEETAAQASKAEPRQAEEKPLSGLEQLEKHRTEKAKVPRPPAADIPAGTAGTPAAGGLSLFDADAVVNGIIFSEILQPPRSRRKRKPGFGRF